MPGHCQCWLCLLTSPPGCFSCIHGLIITQILFAAAQAKPFNLETTVFYWQWSPNWCRVLNVRGTVSRPGFNLLRCRTSSHNRSPLYTTAFNLTPLNSKGIQLLAADAPNCGHLGKANTLMSWCENQSMRRLGLCINCESVVFAQWKGFKPQISLLCKMHCTRIHVSLLHSTCSLSPL